ncbi:T9SS type B sorting domain-containing protein [Chitinophaga lutea]
MNEFYARFRAKCLVLTAVLTVLACSLRAQNMQYFTNPFTMAMANPDRMIAGDFDNDGDMDVLYQNGISPGLGFGYYKNDGNGSWQNFSAAASPGTPFNGFNFTANGGAQLIPGRVFVVDYDADGDVDVIHRSSLLALSIWRNDGGTFSYAQNYVINMATPERMAFGDFDKDGDQDLLYQATNSVGIGFGYVQNNGGGTFNYFLDAASPGTPFSGFDFAAVSASLVPGAFYVVDWDDDGDPDIIDGHDPLSMTAWQNNNGVFSLTTMPFNPGVLVPGKMVFNDFDRDGDIDLLYQRTHTPGGDFGYERNDGFGTFTPFPDAGTDPGTIFTGFDFLANSLLLNINRQLPIDWDNDGDIDILCSQGGMLNLFGNGGYPPSLATTVPADNAVNVALNANIQLTFNMSVNKNAGNIYIVRVADNMLFETISVNSAQVTTNGVDWFIDPSITFLPGTEYAIRFDDGIFKASSGMVCLAKTDNSLSFTAVAIAPVIAGLNGDGVSYTELAAPALLDALSDATVTDADSPNFGNGGSLAVRITPAPTAGDVLSVTNTAPISVTGVTVNWNAFTIGTISGGVGGTPLTVTFNPSATPARVTDLLRAIAYSSTSVNPGMSRTVEVTVTDPNGKTSNVATVTVIITPVNDAPVNTVPSGYTADEGSLAPLTGITFSDPDENTGNANTYAEFAVPISAGATFQTTPAAGITISSHSDATYNYVRVTGTMANVATYVANSGVKLQLSAHGVTGFSINIYFNDQDPFQPKSDLDAIPVTITAINDAPAVSAPARFDITEDTETALTGISFTDVDAGADPVIVTFSVPSGSFSATSGAGVTVGGTSAALTLSGSITDINAFIAGSNLTYTPALNDISNYTATVIIDDNGHSGNDPGGPSPTSESAQTTFLLELSAVNDAPVITAPAGINITEDLPRSITGISITDADGPNASISLMVSLPAGAGTLTATASGGVAVSGTGSATLMLSGSALDVNAYIAGSNITYAPAPNLNGDILLSFAGTDVGPSPLPAAPVTTILHIAAANDVPDLPVVPANFAVSEDILTPVSISFNDIDAGAGIVKVTIIAAQGTWNATTGAGVTVTNSGTGSMILEGTLSDINTFFLANQVGFLTASNSAATPINALARIDDNGNTGAGGNLFALRTFNIVVTAVNDAPVITLPAAQATNMNSPLTLSGANVISINDIDDGGNPAYVELNAMNGVFTLSTTTGLSFTVGDGTNDALMRFTGNVANINAALNGLVFIPANNFYGPASLRVTVDDQGHTGGLPLSDIKSLVITVNPTFPLVTDVSASVGDGTYKVGDFIWIDVTFNQPVIVTGVPQLTLETGATDRVLNYANGGTTPTLRFGYQVQEGESTTDLDYISTTAITLNGGTIKNAASLDANLVLPTPGAAGSLGANRNIVIDGISPTITALTLPGNGAYHIGDNIDLKPTFSEPVTPNLSPRLELNIGGTTVYAQWVNAEGLFRYTVAEGDLDTDGITVGPLNFTLGRLRDAAGNFLLSTLPATGTTAGILVDGQRPTITSLTLPANKLWKEGEVLNITATFSESVAITGAPTLPVTIGATVRNFTLASASGQTAQFTYTIANGDLDRDGISIPASLTLNGATIRDLAGNDAVLTLPVTGTQAGIRVDAVAPVVTAGQSFSINENSAAGALVGTVAGTDPGSTGTLQQWTINNASPFAINAATGALTVVNAAALNYEANASFTLQVQVSDGVNTSAVQTVTVQLNNLPEPPTDLLLSNNQVTENNAPNAAVGTLSSTASQPGATFTYTLVSGTGSQDNASFAISGNQLTVIPSLDFEQKTSYQVRVRSTTQDGDYLEKAFVISVLNQPEPPTNLQLSNAQLLENNAVNALIGTLTSTASQAGATFTYTLVSGTGSQDNASFAISGNQLTARPSFNFEQQPSYQVRVRTTTQYGDYLEKAFTITVLDQNEAPTLGAIGDKAYCVSASDETLNLSNVTAGPEAGQTTTVTVNYTNNALFQSFTVQGNSLRIRFAPGASGTSTVTVTVKDNGGTANGGIDQVQQSFQLSVSSIAAPVITSNKGLEISKGDVAVLTATGGGSSYSWDPAPGILSGQENALLTIRPQQNATYRVTTTNAAGCTASASVDIKVKEDFKVDATNIMTPNGDGINERFVIKNIDSYPQNELKIFDRAGRLIYVKRGYANEWDARLNGKPLAEGTYYYILDFGPGLPKVKGFITVVSDKF